jgi:PAS domain-containing protein
LPVASAPLAGILEKAWDQLPPERHRALRARWLDRPDINPAEAPLLHALAPSGASTLGLAATLAAAPVLLLAVLCVWLWRRQQQGSRTELDRAARLTEVMDRSPALLFEMEQQANGSVVVRYASPEARRLFSIDIDDEALPVEAFLRTIFPEDHPAVLAAIQRSAALRIETEHAYRVMSPTGMRWVKSILRPCAGGNGEGMRWSGITVDISAQKQAELRTEEAERQLREITNNLPGVVFQFQRDLAGTYRLNFASAALGVLRGVRAEDFNRDDDAFLSSVHEEDRDRVRNALDYSAVTLEPLAVEYRVRMGDGHTEWMSNHSHPVRTREGTVIWTGYISNVKIGRAHV